MSDKPFIVSDRRHFTAEGQPRDGSPDGESERATSGAAPSAGPSEPGPAPGQAASGPPPGADFISFVVSLATQASLLLEGQGLPEGAPAREGLVGAQSIISILEMLQDKTEGRRTPGESAVLEDLLYQLRMAYVARARVAGA